MTKSFLIKLSKLFESNLDYFPKLKKFLKEKGFQEFEGKWVMSKELEKISNIQQQYGFEISSVEDGKLRIMWYGSDHFRESVKPILAETEDQAIIIVQSLIEKFLNPKNNGSKGEKIQ